jgi:hypothetical protein
MSELGMLELHKRNLLKGVKMCKLDLCKFCVLGKQNWVQFKTATHKTEGILDYVHYDVWGLVRTASQGGHMYFFIFIDVFPEMFGCTSCGINQRHLLSSNCGKLKWRTKLGRRLSALG